MFVNLLIFLPLLSYLDIAGISIEHCKDRFRQMNNKTYTAEFINIDCTRERIRDHLSKADLLFDMTSCQFSFHYCFESYEQARMMVQNASESLKIGGIFCGTIPDSTEVMKRLKESGTNTYGNDVYSITFPKTYDELISDGVPIFGAKYNFHLTEVVDCPEFLVFFPVFEEICRSFGLQPILKKRFDDFFMENRGETENFTLMNYMDALGNMPFLFTFLVLHCFPKTERFISNLKFSISEKYPPKNNEKLMGTSRDDYKHIREYLSDAPAENISSMGTLSKSEWEAVTLYLVFSFRKVSDQPI